MASQPCKIDVAIWELFGILSSNCSRKRLFCIVLTSHILWHLLSTLKILCFIICFVAATAFSFSSSSSCRYDVFLSFRGKDTRDNFTSLLYAALCRKKIKTFIDDEEFGRGDEISPALWVQLKEQNFWLSFFSKNYASSKWCFMLRWICQDSSMP